MEIKEVKRPGNEVLAKIHSLKQYKGMIAAIEVETGDWFLGKTLLEAVKKGKKKYSKGTFYIVRIGFPFAHQYSGISGLEAMRIPGQKQVDGSDKKIYSTRWKFICLH